MWKLNKWSWAVPLTMLSLAVTPSFGQEDSQDAEWNDEELFEVEMDSDWDFNDEYAVTEDDQYGGYDQDYDWQAEDGWFDDWYGNADQDWFDDDDQTFDSNNEMQTEDDDWWWE